MIAVLEEDWGLGGDYPEPDKYGWRNFGTDEAEEQAKLDKENQDKRSWWDKFWGS